MQPAQEPQTILFSDIRGYSAFTAERGDEEAYRLSTSFFAFAGERIAECKGRVVKTYGDGVMAVFSAPADGIRGAIAVQKGLESRNRENSETAVSAGVGITSGRVVLTGDDAFGHAVNLAKRLSDQANGGQIVIGRGGPAGHQG